MLMIASSHTACRVKQALAPTKRYTLKEIRSELGPRLETQYGSITKAFRGLIRSKVSRSTASISYRLISHFSSVWRKQS